jgi:hypothetical protein
MSLLSGASSSALLVGAVLALVVGLMASVVGLDRDRAFYPTVVMVVASYFVLFAVLGGERRALAVELGFAMVFVVLALAGFRRSLWIVAAALVGHGVFDVFHGQLVTNPGLPEWWPAFCMAYDVVAGSYLVVLLRRRPGNVHPAPAQA